MTNTLIVALMIEVAYFGVRNVKAFNWIKLTFTPWFAAISKAVNPDHK
jgi:hypothetical protein